MTLFKKKLEMDVLKTEHFLLNVNIIEGRHYIWPDMNSVVFVMVDKQKYVSRLKRNTDNPYYNEFFCFEFTTTLEQLFDKTLKFLVLRPWSVCRKRKLLGDVSLDLGTIWNAPDHQFYHKWLILSAPGKNKRSGSRGYLKVNLFILFKGQIPVIPVIDIEKTDEIEGNLLIPGNHLERQRSKYIFTIYKGEKMMKEKYCFANEKRNKCNEDAPNCYIEIRFAGLIKRTSYKKNSTSPIWNERIILKESFPPLCERIRILLFHKEGIKDTIVSSCYIDLKSISSEGENGFLPTFGPAFLYFYFKNQCFAGKLLLSFETVIDDEVGHDINLPITAEQVEDFNEEILGLKNTVLLWCSIFNVNLINKKFRSKQIIFDLSMGGWCKGGNNISKLKNHFAGYFPQKDGKNYYLNIGSVKPCLKLTNDFYNFRERLFACNVIENIADKLKEKLREVEILFEMGSNQMKSAEAKTLLVVAMNDLQEDCENVLTNLPFSDSSSWHTELDRQRRRVIIDEMTTLRKKTQEINNTKMGLIKRFRKEVKMYYRLEKFTNNVQGCWPDVYLWMLSNGKKVAFNRISAKDLIYSDNKSARGKNCARLHGVYFEDINKTTKYDEIACRAEVILWLGNNENENIIHNLMPPGFTLLKSSSNAENSIEELKAQATFEFSCKLHVYSAKLMPIEKNSGLTNSYMVISVDCFAKKTRIIRENLNPKWKETFVINNFTLYGSRNGLQRYPPVTIFEVFHHEDLTNKTDELIGRVSVLPMINFKNEQKICQLRKHDILFNNEKTGEIIVAVELQETQEMNNEEILPENNKHKTDNKNEIEPLPPYLVPMTSSHRVEVYLWGLRNLSKVACLPITKPKIEIYLSDLKLESQVLSSAKNSLNFTIPFLKGDVEISDTTELIPPFLIKMYDVRSFGRLTYAGTNMSFIYRFVYKPITISERNAMIAKNSFQEKRYHSSTTTKRKYLDFDHYFQKLVEIIFNWKNSIFDNKHTPTQKGRELFVNEEDWWKKYFSSIQESSDESDISIENRELQQKSMDTDSMYQITVYTKELEAQKKFEGFNDRLNSFSISKTKLINDDFVDSMHRTALLKAAIKVYRWPMPDNEQYVTEEGYPIEKGVFQHYDSNFGVKFLVRVYVIKGVELRPKEHGYKLDSYLVLTLGNQKINDVKNYIPKQANPIYGRSFEFHGEFPKDYLLKVAVWDHNFTIKNRFVGETKIDIENRVYSKHRARCGLSPEFINYGPYKWRDQKTPTQILTGFCKRYNLGLPEYFENSIKVASKEFYINKYYTNPVIRKENLALAVLRRWNDIPLVGCSLVPEHVETRSLYNPLIPGIEQGKLQMWVDIFPYADLPLPSKVNVSPRKPIPYELRVVIWNTMDVVLEEDDFFTGEKKSNIYIKGWLGSAHEFQHTDVHYRSFNGEGNFNWRFVFRFNYLTAENLIVIHRQEGKIVSDDIEKKVPCKIHLQVWDSETFTPDDFLGTLTMELSQIPRGAKTEKKCTLHIVDKEAPKLNLFRVGRLKGWWPFQNVGPSGKDILTGKLEAEFELLTIEDAQKSPVGLGREAPQPLPPPKRPASSFSMFKSPLHGIKYLICTQHRGKLIICVLTVFLVIFIVLFIYSIPKATVQKILKIL